MYNNFPLPYLLYEACVNVRFGIWQSAFFEMKFKEMRIKNLQIFFLVNKILIDSRPDRKSI
jgi:hypothetical protein